MNQAIKRIPGTNPDEPLRLCPVCRYELPLAYFGPTAKPSRMCHVCRDAKKEAQPWTPRQIAALRHAASRVLDLWPKYFGRWDDDDLQRLRELLAAADRDPGVTTAQLQPSCTGGEADNAAA